MNKYFCIGIIGLLVFSCQEKNNTPLSILIQQRDSLKTKYDELSEELSEIEEQIIALDSNANQNIKNVEYIEVSAQRFAHYFGAQGVVEASSNAQISSESPGRVTKVYVKTGQSVKTGQALFRMDNSVLNSNTQEIDNQIALAEDVFKRQKALHDQDIGAEIDFITAKNNLSALKLKKKSVLAQSAKAVVYAPFTGVVDGVMVKEGQMASPGFPVMRLIGTSKPYIKAELSEAHLSNVHQGQMVLVDIPSIQKKAEAKISRIGRFIDPNNRTFAVEIDAAHLKVNILPNQLVYLHVNDYVNDSALVVPSWVIQQDAQGEDYVYVAQKDQAKTKAIKTIVHTSKTQNDSTEILSGIQSGDWVITSGSRLLTNGEQIKLLETK